jgi:predicted HicB family RNase H-like nuclease
MPPRKERTMGQDTNPQVFMNIYIESELKRFARRQAAEQEVSISAFVSQLIMKEQKRIERKLARENA